MAGMEPIAIIGSGCKFPGSSSSPSRLWDLVRDPQDVASKTPRKRFNMDGFFHPNWDQHGTTNSAESYYLQEDVREFDAQFFNISPAEAASMDPQQRLLLETVYESLDTAGLRLDLLQGSSTGVYCGIMNIDYTRIVAADIEMLPPYMAPGIASSILSNRLSYFFDWHGPSMTLDTACSGSLVSLHLAVEALRKRDCSLAVAAGSNLILVPDTCVSDTKMQMLSPTGRSRMWDEKADGYARGEGVGSVILKRLDDAIRDGDRIESVIRASGVNSDGRTTGLTMPSSEAQQALIRSTYVQAGLNPDDPKDRCQYFEAHGTGTPAGDPKEAAAIYNAFFQETGDDKLYVGSIKTVIGHTESAAGIAGIIKASLALQNKVIPPNLHFDTFNPDIAPFSSRLQIPLSAVPWPELPAGAPRRVSVNSFGFGGTNAHVILESFDQSTPDLRLGSMPSVPVLPFVFSAVSELSLGAVLEQYGQFLRDNPDVDLLDLASSLMTRRSAFSNRIFLTASSHDGLLQKIQEELDQRLAKNPSTIVSRPGPAPKRILGVFTGQGAQWAQMGLDLIQTCPEAKSWLDELQESLDQLPSEWRPDFSLLDELSVPAASSRIGTSELSLTLRTALQIIQVNYLRSLGITFAAVVGHSSGEISAAYAAGILSASDTIRTAYLRGVASNEAGANGKHGGMLAVGISSDQAEALLEDEPYTGNVTIAAMNSPSNVTLSGDADLLQELGWLLKSLDLSPRHLRVDTAYHSHHMQPCAEPYIRALEACQIQVNSPSTKWYSSVYDGQLVENVEDLRAEYWKENMLRPVMFSQAITSAIEQIPDVDLIVEVGPQAALRGPTLQTISTISPDNADVPYVGLADRNAGGVEAMAKAIGSFWTYLGANSVDIAQYTSLFNPSKKLAFVDNLPTYPFDHSKTYWVESRISKTRLYRPPPNALLGVISPEVGEGEYRWRNYLRREELEWLNDHQIQSQSVFPGTGYMVMVLEAATIIAGKRSLSLVDIQNLAVDRAISISDDVAGTETLFKVEQMQQDGNTISATFDCQASFDGSLKSCASGQMIITLGKQDPEILPMRSSAKGELQPVDMADFYGELEELGYGYTGLFKALTNLSRKKDVARGTIPVTAQTDQYSPLLFHPATIDTGLHALFAAIGAPKDGQLTTLLLPTKIDRMTINPAFCRNGAAGKLDTISVDAAITNIGPIQGDVDLFDQHGRGIIQIEGVHVSPLMTSPDHNPPIFSETTWGPLELDASQATSIGTSDFWSNRRLGDRVALLYLRDVSKQLTSADREGMDWHRSRYAAWMDWSLASVRDGTHPIHGPEALEGDVNEVAATVPKESKIVLRTIQRVGENLLAFLRGETTILEALRQDDMLTQFYENTHEVAVSTRNLASFVSQIAFRYPRMKMLEIGAGTGSATREVLKRIGRDYHSYTYTDISAAFFEDAQTVFAEHEDRFVYEVLDIDADPVKQDFAMHSYDMVIANNVLHATRSLSQTLQHARKLLKPGGKLVVMEITTPDAPTFSFIFGGFDGWWRGENDGRTRGPLVNCEQWDKLLKATGFGGFETASPKEEGELFGISVFVSEAVDDTVKLLRDPLTVSNSVRYNDLFLVGGATNATSSLIPALHEVLKPHFHRIFEVQNLDDFVAPEDSSLATVLALSDMDWPCLKDLTESRFKGLKSLIGVAGKLLWVATNPEDKDPYMTMSKGLLQSIAYENAHALFQHLTIADPSAVTAELLATTLMRLAHTDFDNDYNMPNCVGNTETELLFEDGVMKIPRIHANSPMNQRFFASRGTRAGEVDVRETPIKAAAPTQDRPGFSLTPIPQQQCALIQDTKSVDSSTRIHVRYSTLSAVRIDGLGFVYIILGYDIASERRKVALSVDHASLISTPSSWCWDIPSLLQENEEPAYLKDIAATLSAVYLVNKVSPNTTLLVHEADDVSRTLRVAISSLSSLRGISALFTTSNKSLEHAQGVKFVHPKHSKRTVSNLLPTDISVTAKLCRDSHGNYSRIESVLSQDVARYDVSSFYQPTASLEKDHELHPVSGALSTACMIASQTAGQRQTIPTINIQDLPQHTADGLEILDWTSPNSVPAEIQSASAQVTLSANKTYLLIGLTGDLGRSVCHWMITRGARHVVLTSRSPKIDPRWIDEMATLGGRVIPLSMDVTSRQSILNVDSTIKKELPPIGGVVNGAMVMNDILFTDISLDATLRTFAPKVQGSLLLDELYRDLDFFILFGSLSGVIGNFNQAAYGAANAFMTGLVQRRRRENLPASIINPGEIRGLGYVARMGSSLSDLMAETLGLTYSSERDLHELFAEGILASPHNSGRNPEIVCGLRQTDPVKRPNVIWYRSPKMWPFIDYVLQSNVASSNGQTAPVKVQLESATSVPDAAGIIATNFMVKIRNKLNLAGDTPLTGKFLLSELGIDSLVAVDLRLWFVKELGVDIPVLRLLGGSTIDNVASEAATKFDASLIPLVKLA